MLFCEKCKYVFETSANMCCSRCGNPLTEISDNFAAEDVSHEWLCDFFTGVLGYTTAHCEIHESEGGISTIVIANAFEQLDAFPQTIVESFGDGIYICAYAALVDTAYEDIEFLQRLNSANSMRNPVKYYVEIDPEDDVNMLVAAMFEQKESSALLPQLELLRDRGYEKMVGLIAYNNGLYNYLKHCEPD